MGSPSEARFPLPADDTNDFLLTPEIAQDWHDNRTHPQNRVITLSKVEDFKRLAKSGLWLPHHPEPYIFSPDGYQWNGIKRTLAIAESDISVPVRVIVNMSFDKYYATIDNPQRRSLHQFIKDENDPTKGFTAKEIVASAVRYIGPVLDDAPRGTDRYVFYYPKLDLVAGLAIEEAWRTELRYWSVNIRGGNLLGISASQLTALCAMAQRAEGDEELIHSYVAGVAHGIGLKSGMPAHTLRERYISDGRNLSLRGNSSARARLMAWAYLVKTFNAHMEGREDFSKKQLVFRPNYDKLPEVYGAQKIRSCSV